MMTKHAASALRPRSKFFYKDKKWTVLDNDTLNQVLTIKVVGERQSIRLRYNSGTVITCYWVPFNQR